MIHTYLVTLLRMDSTGELHDIEEPAFTAADAIAQVELRQRGHSPGYRIYCVKPCPPKEAASRRPLRLRLVEIEEDL